MPLVVPLRELLRYLHHLHRADLEPAVLEPLDDSPDEASLHAVRLDHGERPLDHVFSPSEGFSFGSALGFGFWTLRTSGFFSSEALGASAFFAGAFFVGPSGTGSFSSAFGFSCFGAGLASSLFLRG